MMKPLSAFLYAAAALASTVHAAAQLPTQDPFYVPPGNISAYAAGEVIRTRNISNLISGFFVGNTTLAVQAAWQYFFRTTDSVGRPVAAMTTLLVPFNADPTKLLSYQTAYDSTDDNCVPSYSLQAGGNSTDDEDIVFIAAALNRGWYVVTSDYEGLNTQFVAGIQAGQAALDGVRAALHEASTSGLSPSARYGLFGYSGGGLATAWAAELQPSYAPELAFEGATVGGLPANITHSLLAANGGPNAALAFAGVEGLSRAYANLSAYVDAHLIPARRAEFETLVSGCMSRPNANAAGKDLFSYFDGGAALLSDAVPASVLRNAGQLGNHGTPAMPLFVYKAEGDEIAPVADTDALMAKYCGRGATVEYQKDTVGGHATEAITGSATAFAWITDRLDGVPVQHLGQCVITEVTLTKGDLKSITALAEIFIATLQSLLGGRLGPNAS